MRNIYIRHVWGAIHENLLVAWSCSKNVSCYSVSIFSWDYDLYYECSMGRVEDIYEWKILYFDHWIRNVKQRSIIVSVNEKGWSLRKTDHVHIYRKHSHKSKGLLKMIIAKLSSNRQFQFQLNWTSFISDSSHQPIITDEYCKVLLSSAQNG